MFSVSPRSDTQPQEETLIQHLSYSTLADWKECGEKVRLRKVENLRGAPSWSLIGGSLVHTITENLDRQDFGIPVDGPTEFNEDVFLAFIEAEEDKSQSDRADWRAAGRVSKEWPNKENYDWWLHNGPAMVNNWRRFLSGPTYQIAMTPDGAPAIELSIEFELGGVKVVGYIDRVLEHFPTGELIVVDLKSGSRDPLTSDQLGLYRVGLSARYGEAFTPVWGTYFMTRKGATTLPVDLRKYSDGRLEYEYDAAWRGIQAGIFIPKVGPLCSSCGVREFCRAVDGSQADKFLPYRKEVVNG